MPITPILGLSLLIHIGIIAWRKLFSWVPRQEQSQKPATFLMRTGAFSIMVLVFSFMFSTAFLMVRASILDSHSSIRIVDNYVTSTLGHSDFLPPVAILSRDQSEAAAGSISMSSPRLIPAMPVLAFNNALGLQDCAAAFSIWAASYNESVVNYLKSNNMGFTVQARSQFAQNFGIRGYQGTAEQNETLLIDFFIQTHGISSLDALSCKI